VKPLLLLALLTATADAAEHRWLKRLTAIGVCAVSGADLATTAIGVSRGGHETNGLLAHNGQPLWGRMIGINAGACGAAIVGTRLPARYMVPGALAFVGIKGAAVGHNLGELNK
jgi:hypothetical protein